MTDAQRISLLDKATAELKLTTDGYTPGGTHWQPAMDYLDKLRLSLSVPPQPSIVFPLPRGEGGSVCQGLHETAGIPGNWAIDFCDAAGTHVLSPEAGTVSMLSGHDPSTATPNPQGIYGWSIYVRTNAGYVYYVTHLGIRAPLAVGAKVKVGLVLGSIGNQQPYTGRPNHTHVGVTSPHGQTDAKSRITTVSKAPRMIG